MELLLLLLFVNILYIFFAYQITGKRLFSPWIIMMASYVPVVIMAIFNIERWGQTVHFYTVMIVVTAFTCWGVGDITGRYFLKNKRRNPSLHVAYFVLPKWFCIITFFIGIVVCMGFYKYIEIMATSVGFTGGGQILRYARFAELYADSQIKMPVIVILGRSFCKAASFVSLYCLICNKIFFNNFKNYPYYMLIQIPYIIVMVLSTGRIEIMYYICYIMILFLLTLSLKSSWHKKMNAKIYKLTIKAFLVVLFLFWIMGFLTGKTTDKSLWDTFSVYIGTPIVNLDIFLENPSEPLFFGQETLSGITKILNGLGANFEIMPYYQLYKQPYANVNSNLYTSLRRYYHDYGFLGLCIIEMGLGFIYSYWLETIKYKNKLSISVFLFACFFYPIIESGIEERFFNTILIARTVYDMFFFLIIFSFFLKKNEKSMDIHFSSKRRFKFVLGKNN